MKIIKRLLSIIIICCSSVNLNSISIFPHEASALDENDIKEIIDNYAGCQIGGMADVIADPRQTCVQDPLLNQMIGVFFGATSLNAPGYLNAKMVLRMNVDYLSGNGPDPCSAIPYSLDHFITGDPSLNNDNPKLKFGFCSNFLLAKARAAKQAEIAALLPGIAIRATIEGWDVDRIVSEFLTIIPPKDFTETYDEEVDSSGYYVDPLFPVPVFYKTRIIDDKLCVLSSGIINDVVVGCRYLQEPFKISKASQIQSINGCGYFDDCIKEIDAISKSPFSASGPIIHCIKKNVDAVLGSGAKCNVQPVSANGTIGDNDFISYSNNDTGFKRLQAGLRTAIKIFMTIYVTIFAMNILLNPQSANKANIINGVGKIIFVSYCGIGIFDENGQLRNGLSDYVFPVIFSISSTLSEIMFDSSSIEGLCQFNDYPPGFEFMKLWDAIDCRIGFYLGSSLGNFLPSPTYLTLIPFTILSGGIVYSLLSLILVILVIFVLIHIISYFVLALIFVAITAFLAPLFVPMILFDFTKKTFNAWLNLLITYSLQPIISITFLAMMFSIYDYSFFKNCEFTPVNLNIKTDITNGPELSTIKKIKYFLIRPPANATEDEMDLCKSSIGYMLRNVALEELLTRLSAGIIDDSTKNPEEQILEPAESVLAVAGAVIDINESKLQQVGSAANYIKEYVQTSGNIFFSFSFVDASMLADVVSEMVVLVMFMYLFYHLSGSIGTLASEITAGGDLGGFNVHDGMSMANKTIQSAKKSYDNNNGGKQGNG